MKNKMDWHDLEDRYDMDDNEYNRRLYEYYLNHDVRDIDGYPTHADEWEYYDLDADFNDDDDQFKNLDLELE